MHFYELYPAPVPGTVAAKPNHLLGKENRPSFFGGLTDRPTCELTHGYFLLQIEDGLRLIVASKMKAVKNKHC